MEHHPWFHVAVLSAASSRSAARPMEAVGARWAMPTPIPEALTGLVVRDAVADAEAIARDVDFVFCAVDMPEGRDSRA
ncbi:MAG: hypothetical protein V8Q43_02415 [Christensenellaceae bacterium]